jgi:hypothetical protein
VKFREKFSIWTNPREITILATISFLFFCIKTPVSVSGEQERGREEAKDAAAKPSPPDPVTAPLPQFFSQVSVPLSGPRAAQIHELVSQILLRLAEFCSLGAKR